MRTRLTIRTAGALLAAAVLPAAGWAQETTGPGPDTGGTVIKGKAPVSKKVLTVRLPRPKTITLTNGVTMYVLEDHRLPSVRISLTMKGGSLTEPKPGVAGMTAALLTEATERRTQQQIADETEAIGASVSASSSNTTCSISVSGLSESLDTLVDLLADVLLHPAFPQDRLDRAKYNENSQSGQRRSNPTGLMSELVQRTLYSGSPLARSAPTSEQTAAITRADLIAWHGAAYLPKGAIIGVTGDVSATDLAARLEKALADWKPEAAPAELPAINLAAKTATKVFIVDRPGSAQTVLNLGNLAVPRDHPDYIPLVVANRVLGGGSAARLFQNIRERKGYTYGAYSSLSGGQWAGTWVASASVRTEVTEPAAIEFLKEFERLQTEPVPAEELDRAKRSIVGSFALTLESTEAILGRTLELVQGNLPLSYWDTYPKRVQAVTAADIQRVAKAYLGAGRVQIFAVGERKSIEAGLAKLGPVEIVDAASLSGGRGGGRRGR